MTSSNNNTVKIGNGCQVGSISISSNNYINGVSSNPGKVHDDKEDIKDVMELFSMIGFDETLCRSYANIIVKEHEIKSEQSIKRKFNNKELIEWLCLDSDGVNKCDAYFNKSALPPTPPHDYEKLKAENDILKKQNDFLQGKVVTGQQKTTEMLGSISNDVKLISASVAQMGDSMRLVVNENKLIRNLLEHVSNKDVEIFMSRDQVAELDKYRSELADIKKSLSVLPASLKETMRVSFDESLKSVNTKIDVLLKGIHDVPTLAIVLPCSSNKTVVAALKDTLFHKYALFFICSHTLQIVPCGEEGKGYHFRMAKSEVCAFVTKIRPIVQVSMVILHIALMSQGISIPLLAIPDIQLSEGSLKEVSSVFSIPLDTESFKQARKDGSSSIDEESIKKTLNINIENTRAAFVAMKDFLKTKDDERMHYTGLVKVVSPSGKVGWIKDDPQIIDSFMRCDGERKPASAPSVGWSNPVAQPVLYDAKVI